MRYALKSTATEDIVQLFDSSDAPKAGVASGDVVVQIRKQGDSDFSTKTLAGGDWTGSGTAGTYIIKFSASEVDTLGLFRYTVKPVSAGSFKDYDDALQVVSAFPSAVTDPPTVNTQTDSPVGVSPDPVSRGSTLTINGTNLLSTNAVTVNGVSATITAATASQVQVTVGSSVPLGSSVAVVVTTPGGSASATVDVVLATGDIPGSGMCALTGNVYSPGSGQPLKDVPVYGRVLAMPNLAMGVSWADDVVTAVTDSNGAFSLSLPRSVRVEVNIPRVRYRRVFTTPNSATKNIFTEIA